MPSVANKCSPVRAGTGRAPRPIVERPARAPPGRERGRASPTHAERLGQGRERPEVGYPGEEDLAGWRQVGLQSIEDAGEAFPPVAAAAQAQRVVDAEDHQRDVLSGRGGRHQLAGRGACSRTGAREDLPDDGAAATSGELGGELGGQAVALMRDTDPSGRRLTDDQQPQSSTRVTGALDAGTCASSFRQRGGLSPDAGALPAQHRRE